MVKYKHSHYNLARPLEVFRFSCFTCEETEALLVWVVKALYDEQIQIAK